MSAIRGFTLTILLISGSVAFGQLRISEILIEDLQRTKTDYLIQFIDFEVGDIVDSVRLERNRQRLVNLEILADVSYEISSNEEEAKITFHCKEVRTLLPLFNFGGVEDNFWFLLGATEVNLGGRGNKLLGYYQYYDRSSIGLSLFLDRFRQTNWGIQLNYVKWSTVEPLFFEGGTATYDYDNFTYGAGFTYHLNFHKSLEFNSSYFSEEYNRVDENVVEGAPQRGKDT